MQNLSIQVKAISLIFTLFFFIFKSNYAQQIDLNTDLMLIETVAKQQIPVSGKRSYIYKDQPKTIKNSNPLSLAFGGSLYVYQNFVSQHFSASCLYHPSCSGFSKQAVKEFGMVKGILLSFDRLNRCNRIAATDLHPEKMDIKLRRFRDPVKLYK